MRQPDTCLKGRCYFPIACSGWERCFERKLTEEGDTDMTEHEKLRLKQHLERAAQAYDQKAFDLKDSGPFVGESVSCNTVANAYSSMARDARMLKELIK